MRNSKKQIIAILISMLFFNFVMSQNWNTTVSIFTDSLLVEVDANDTAKIEIELPYLKQNIIYDVFLINKSDSSSKAITTSFFKFDPQKYYLNYAVNLNEAKQFSISPYLNFGNIKLLNFSEFLFSINYRYQLNLNIKVVEGEKTIDLGKKTLKQWILNPVKISSNKTILSINNIDFYTNGKSVALKEILANSYKDYLYEIGKESKEVIILEVDDSLNYKNVAFQNVALVYVDSSLVDNSDVLLLQKTILNTSFKWVSPYHIYPFEEGRDLEQNWMAIATSEYLALKYLLVHNLITEQQFFTVIENKITQANDFVEYSLYDMSFDCYNHPEYYQAFYSKGVVALWMLDFTIINFNNGSLSFYDLISGHFPMMNEQLNLALNEMLFEVNEDLVNSKGVLNYNKYLSSIGLKYVDQPRVKILPKENILSSEKELWEKFMNKKDNINE